jgi:integrase
MTEILNDITNGKAMVVASAVQNLPAKKHFWASEYTRPVSFISEDEVYQIADAALPMRNGERNSLLVLTAYQCALRVTEAVKLRVKDKVMVSGLC